jgi:hypothetical protein
VARFVDARVAGYFIGHVPPVNLSITLAGLWIEAAPSMGGTALDQALETRIRQRAYEIWDALGRPDEQAGAHWLAAERELLTAAMRSMPPANRTTVKQEGGRKSPRQAKLTRARARKMAAAS